MRGIPRDPWKAKHKAFAPRQGRGDPGPRTRPMGATPAFGRTAPRFPAPLPRCEFLKSLPDPGVRGIPRPLATFLASLQDAPARRHPPLSLRFRHSPGPRCACPLTKSGVALRLPPQITPFTELAAPVKKPDYNV